MKINENLPSKVFVDTWGWFAIANTREVHYQIMNQILDSLLKSRIHIITTDFILDETYTLVRLKVNHSSALLLHQKIEQIYSSNLMEIIHISSEIQQISWRIFERYADKTFSFTDCTSFAIMRSMEITHVLTNDHHFEQMGFSIIP
jgi:predicted nucleic acid-binding protein